MALIPKPVRRIFWILLFAIVGYYTFDVIRSHTRQEVLALKHYSKSLLSGDIFVARKLVVDDRGLRPFRVKKERNGALGGDIKFVYYKIKLVKRSKDGKKSRLLVQQIFRINPPGQTSFWGTEEITNTMQVVMAMSQSQWQVETYSDNYYNSTMKE